MTTHRTFSPGQPFPSRVENAIFEFISTYMSPNFGLALASSTSVSVAAGTGNDQVAVGIAGTMRWNSAVVSATVSGSTGTKNVYVTAPTLDAAAEDAGTFDHSFTLSVGTAPPGSGVSRLIATLAWSGSAITSLSMLVGPRQLVLPAWTRLGSSDVYYYKQFDRVWFKGSDTIDDDTSLGQLPAGYRPGATATLVGWVASVVRPIYIHSDGNIYGDGTTGVNTVSFDGLSFRAEA